MKEQKIIDSDVAGTRNHYNSIAELNMWSDYHLNVYLMCAVSMDQFVFKFKDCPASISVYAIRLWNICRQCQDSSWSVQKLLHHIQSDGQNQLGG